MQRKLSGWGATIAGLLLASGGAYAMWTGWDMILLERGWSLFIAGAVALSGGVVTMALGRVIAHLARLGGPVEAVALSPAASLAESAPAATRTQAEALPHPPPAQEVSPATPESSKPDFSNFLEQPAKLNSDPAQEPTEVDRYAAGDATYIMMSDGSVEVRNAAGSQRYPSLAALRAEAETRQR